METIARAASFLTLVLFAAAPGAAAAQDPPKPEARTVTASRPAPSPSVVFEKQHTRVRLDDDGRATRRMTMHVRANDDAGVRQAGQIPLVYAPSSDDLEIASLEVRKADGRVLPVGTEAIQDHAIQPSAPVPIFVDLRQKTVTVPALQPGDTVAISAVWTVARPLAGRHAWFGHSFVKHAVVIDERLELDVPAGMRPLIQVGPSAPAEQNGGEGRLAGDRRIYTWQTSNPVADDEREELGAQEEAPVPDVRITTFPDWQTFAGWLAPLMRPPADEIVRAKVLELTKGLSDPAAKIEAIYHYVSTQIRYVSLSFGLNRYAPHEPADVLRNQYGDCKDKHALMAAMLREIGVHAVPVLLNTTRSITEAMPSPDEFDHVITAIPAGDDPASWSWFDTTLEIAPAGLLAPNTRERLALSLGDGRRPSRLVTTPRDGPAPTLDATHVEGRVSSLGVLTADVRLTSRGDTELVLRSAARAMPREMLDEFGKQFAKALGFGGDVSGFAFSDPLATREPFEVRFRIRQAGYLDWAAGRATVGVVLGTLETSGLDPERTPLKVDRKVRSVAALRRTFAVQLPPGYVARAPVGVRAAKDDFVYTSTYGVDVDGVLRAERRLDGQPRVLVVAHATDYSRIARSIAADHGQKFTIERTAAVKPEIPADLTASELYGAGHSAFNAADYETSVAIWRHAADKDPKFATPLYGLGLAYQRLQRYDEAIETLEKARGLDPTNKKIHADLGFVYKEAGRLEEAADAYARHLAAAPLDAVGHKALADIQFDLGRHDAAVSSIERALSLSTDDPWLHQQLGRSLLALDRLPEAMAAFDAALKGDRTPAMTSSIAWTLAVRGIEDARVLELSAQAIDSITGTMKALDAASLRAEHFRLMERLAWAWDAQGLVQMRRGLLDEAVRSFEAAWQLGATSHAAEHLAQAYEKKDRLVDAATYFLTARMLDPTPGPELEAGLRRHYAGMDVEKLIDAARRNAARERSVRLAVRGLPGSSADINALLGTDGRILDAVAAGNAGEPFEGLLSAVWAADFRVSAPARSTAIRLAARVRVSCRGEDCVATIAAPRTVR